MKGPFNVEGRDSKATEFYEDLDLAFSLLLAIRCKMSIFTVRELLLTVSTVIQTLPTRPAISRTNPFEACGF